MLSRICAKVAPSCERTHGKMRSRSHVAVRQSPCSAARPICARMFCACKLAPHLLQPLLWLGIVHADLPEKIVVRSRSHVAARQQLCSVKFWICARKFCARKLMLRSHVAPTLSGTLH